MEYGLIGEKLSHSFSKEIHESLCSYSYEICPLAPDAVAGFLKERAFRGINVTIPYKQVVMPHLDEIDEKARLIGAVNTIVNRDGRLCGYNTDYDGFQMLLEQNGISVKGETVLVMGNGGASQTVQAVLRALGAANILVVDIRPAEGIITKEEAMTHSEVSVVINATPIGMFPKTDESSIDLSVFPALKAAADLVYNPMRTRFLQQAEEMGAVAANGLLMLVAQAAKAAEHFIGTKIDPRQVIALTRKMEADKQNLVLTGMPGSGKTTVGKLLAKKLGKQFCDLDQAIVSREGMTIPEIFERFGEAGFREREAAAVKEASQQNGLVISTGGGVPMFPENVRNLRMNGRLFFLDRPLAELAVGDGRPLSQTRADTEALYRKRIDTYRATCDYCIPNGETAGAAVDRILEELKNDR